MSTACHLGICIAVRVSEAVPLVNGSLDIELQFSISSLEKALKFSALGKRSKQRFLKASSRDDFIKKAKKGAGGNTVPYKCFVIKQSVIPVETEELLRKGITCSQIIVTPRFKIIFGYAGLAKREDPLSEYVISEGV